MTEPVQVDGPRLYLNASVFGNKGSADLGNLRVRVISDIEVPDGFAFEDCNGLARGDRTDFEVTWGPKRDNLARFVGRKVRLHFHADAAANFYSYRFGA